jgi:hypothetical protein
MALVSALFWLIRSLIAPRTSLVAENLALRQQLAVLNRKIHRPQLRRRDRFFWVILSQLWKNWREVLIIVKPETVIKWHRQGFKLYWRWKSKAQVGRPKIDKEIHELIKRMSLENPLWGTPRIQSELRLLGFDLAESTVAKYRVKGSASPSQTWKTFLSNHAKQIAAIDFFTVPTLTFRNLYCFIMPLDLAGGHPTRVERDDLVVEVVEPSLPLLDELRIELLVAVTRDLDRDLALLAFERSARLAVAGVAGVLSFWRVFLVAEMMSHLSVQDPFNEGFGELLEQTILTKKVFRFLVVF